MSSLLQDQPQEALVKVEGKLFERGNDNGQNETGVIHFNFQNTLTEGRQDHQEALPQRGGDLSVVELSDASEIPFGKVQTNLLPRLAHG